MHFTVWELDQIGIYGEEILVFKERGKPDYPEKNLSK